MWEKWNKQFLLSITAAFDFAGKLEDTIMLNIYPINLKVKASFVPSVSHLSKYGTELLYYNQLQVQTAAL